MMAILMVKYYLFPCIQYSERIARGAKPLRNVDHLTLDVPFGRTDVFKNSFLVRICRLWNNLPLSIRESNTLSIFRKNLMALYYDKFNVNFTLYLTQFFL